MSATVKKWFNRGGLIAIGVGVILTIVGGGDPSAALSTGATIAAIAGTVAILIREIFN